MPLTEISRQRMGWKKGKTFTSHIKSCEVCGQGFKTSPSQSNQYTCSYRCNGIRKRKWPQKRKCEFCDNFYLANRKSSRFCNKSCGTKSQNRKPSVRATLITVMPRSEMKECDICKYNKHPEILVRHHINRDRTNNLIENIQVLCPNCHDEVHFLEHTGKWHLAKKET